MGLNTVRISFYTDVEASTYEAIDKKISDLIGQLASVETDLAWEDVDWQITHAPQPLTRKDGE